MGTMQSQGQIPVFANTTDLTAYAPDGLLPGFIAETQSPASIWFLVSGTAPPGTTSVAAGVAGMVWLQDAGTSGAAVSTANRARAVVTAIAAYAGTGTATLTASANGALAAQDVVTLAVGDVVLLAAGITNVVAKDTGPWIVVALGAGGAKYVLTRPTWWVTGDPILQGTDIRVSGEGAVFKGSSWRAMCGKGKVIGTDDPVLYPKNYRKTVTLVAGTYTLGAGGGLENLYLFDTTLATVHPALNTPGGTMGTGKFSAPSASRVAGYAGTAAVVINSLVDAGTVETGDTSTVDVLVTNY